MGVVSGPRTPRPANRTKAMPVRNIRLGERDAISRRESLTIDAGGHDGECSCV